MRRAWGEVAPIEAFRAKESTDLSTHIPAAPGVAFAGRGRKEPQDLSWPGVDADRRVLFHGNGLGEVAWLVDVAAAAHGDVVGEQLQRHNLNERREQRIGRRNGDDVLNETA